MDRDQHITQDAAEFYAVYLMAKTAEEMGVAILPHSKELWQEFVDYLAIAHRDWAISDFGSRYPAYKANADAQVPAFVQRLAVAFPGSKFAFEVDEARLRNLGKKADFILTIDEPSRTYAVSLKNYVGPGGVKRPQVSSGTFLSFAAGFVFERNGVGTYVDPRTPDTSFKGSNTKDRDAVLAFEGRADLAPLLMKLVDLQQHVRSRLLTLRYYDQAAVKGVVAEIVPQAQDTLLSVFDVLGHDVVRQKFLERANLDGGEDALYFDGLQFADSITNPRFRELYARINDPNTTFKVVKAGQSLRFSFEANGAVVVSADVPLTINTNGAWHRPKPPYQGKQLKVDKGVPVELEWGEIRPRKSKEIATSTNLYLDLAAAGVFGGS
ncbi:MAG: hypothetical protein B7Y93_00100 [Micrococcales bacterium 32-70-13]|nr:MAG: hypothetical protein B7Y93_00100 [Micrococcales bacterium 32-70-13]